MLQWLAEQTKLLRQQRKTKQEKKRIEESVRLAADNIKANHYDDNNCPNEVREGLDLQVRYFVKIKFSPTI